MTDPATTSPAALPPRYDAATVEAEVTAAWDDADLFRADPSDPGEPFAVVIPPPNVTAALHLGHALNNTIQDILVRHARMQGKNAVWLPGTDHAGIATQTVVEKRVLAEEGRRRVDFGREEFVAKIQAWKDEYERTILGQLKAMGCSCDWSRTAFTMDPPRAEAVREAFARLFRDGLIYRGKRLVNWDPVTQTALADDEVEMEEVDGHFYYLRYPLASPDRQEGVPSSGRNPEPLPDGRGSRQYVVVATTRPETMLGDTAVAINPNDPRAAALRGRTVVLPIVGRVIPIVEDDYVVMPDDQGDDPKAKFATGLLKVTPAHDPNDWDIGQRHGLAVINVMGPDASISDAHGWTPETDAAQAFVGMSREDARRAVVAWFKENGLLEEVRPYRHSVGHSYRSHAAVEPYLSDQWYVAVKKPIPWMPDAGVVEGTDVPVNSLAGLALTAVEGTSLTQTPRSVDASPDRQGGVGLGTLTYLITFTTYGTWLRGSEKGSADRKAHNIPGDPYFIGDEREEQGNFERLKHPPMVLDEPARDVVQTSLLSVSSHRGWKMHALHVRSNHLHTVVTADVPPERVMSDFKSYATRALRARDLVGDDANVWTRHGSTRYLKSPGALEAAVIYTLDRQGKHLKPEPFDGAKWVGPKEPLPDGRGSQDPVREETSALRFVPERYARTFHLWHENLRDWCISRQLWWGHQIPVWTDVDGNHRLEATPGATRDPDVLDTWFSSALWPLSTLGWPDDTPDLATWNPTAVLCTAREIITLWVSRMTMFNRYMLAHPDGSPGPVPFRDVFIHAMIQDGEGRKMSKSLGNGVDPLDVIATHGADAMRFTLAQMTTQTQDVRLPVERDADGGNTSPKFDLGRNFSNKIWNASRFVIAALASPDREEGVPDSELRLETVDRWILSRLCDAVRQADAAIAEYRFDRYATACYDFFWRDFCDWYVEAAKPRVRAKDASGRAARATLAACLDAGLRLLHPAMPFVTERLWWSLNEVTPDRSLPGVLDLPPSRWCAKAAWPAVACEDAEAEADVEAAREVVEAVRRTRMATKTPPKQVLVVAADVAEGVREAVEVWANCTLEGDVPGGVEVAAGGGNVRIGNLAAADDVGRVAKERADLEKQVATLRGRLANAGYTDRAPPHLVQETRDQLAAAEADLVRLSTG